MGETSVFSGRHDGGAAEAVDELSRDAPDGKAQDEQQEKNFGYPGSGSISQRCKHVKFRLVARPICTRFDLHGNSALPRAGQSFDATRRFGRRIEASGRAGEHGGERANRLLCCAILVGKFASHRNPPNDFRYSSAYRRELEDERHLRIPQRVARHSARVHERARRRNGGPDLPARHAACPCLGDPLHHAGGSADRIATQTTAAPIPATSRPRC